MERGGIFVALRGPKLDGHSFIPEILSRRPLAIILEKGREALTKDAPEVLAIAVTDTDEAHRLLAAAFRRKLAGPVVAIAGSNGKTTTKSCLAHLVTGQYRYVVTQGSQNGWQGIPKTWEQVRPDSEGAILEIGIDAPGFMEQYARLNRPDIAIVTSIGEEHMAHFQGLQQIFEEETLILRDTLARGGWGIVPRDDEWLSQLPDHPRLLRVTPEDGARWGWTHPYPHHLQNAAMAVAAARLIGLQPEQIRERLQSFELPDGRGQLWALRPDLWIIADHYNANPTSMLASLESAGPWAQSKGLPLHLVLGDMLDLGDHSSAAHEDLAHRLPNLADGEITLIGPEFFQATQDLSTLSRIKRYARAEELQVYRKQLFQKAGVYLVKASRGMRLEQFLPQHPTTKDH